MSIAVEVGLINPSLSARVNHDALTDEDASWLTILPLHSTLGR